MRVHICAVGRLRTGPEDALIQDYLTRFDRTGRALSLTMGEVREVEDKKGKGMEAEAELLLRAIPEGAQSVALDERGQIMTSPEFAGKIAAWRDDGCSDLAFVIGGADGLSKELRSR